jgi:hypothetical protein
MTIDSAFVGVGFQPWGVSVVHAVQESPPSCVGRCLIVFQFMRRTCTESFTCKLCPILQGCSLWRASK